MAQVDWDERMNIGEERIDEQHRELVAIINDIGLAAERGAGRKELGGLIRAFCDYAQVHFRTEESFLKVADYPEYFQQVGEHENCSTRALAFYRAYINGEDVLIEDFLSFVSTWFVEHTLGVDQSLRAYLQKKATAKPGSARL